MIMRIETPVPPSLVTLNAPHFLLNQTVCNPNDRRAQYINAKASSSFCKSITIVIIKVWRQEVGALLARLLVGFVVYTYICVPNVCGDRDGRSRREPDTIQPEPKSR